MTSSSAGVMAALVVRDGAARVEERPMPKPGPLDVIVRTTAASLCSADVACVQGEFPATPGIVLGHEAVGVVHAAGKLVRGFSAGQRVAAMSTTPCGRCTDCQRGYGGHCGGAAWAGYTSGVTRDGTTAEFFAVPDAEYNLAVIPDGVDDASALCVTDTLASGTTGPEAARIPMGGTVAVFGQGHIGLAAVAGARLLGAGLVIAVKARPGGEAVALAMGADYSFNLGDHDIEAEISCLTGAAGVDCAIEASGVAASFPRAVAATRHGGVIVVLSSYAGPPEAVLPVPLAHWGRGIGDKTILSTFQRPGADRMRRLLRLVETGRLDPTPLITHRYGFSDVERGFEDVAARRAGYIKPLISF